MQINYKGITIQVTPQEFNSLVSDGIIDQMISAVFLLGISTEDLLNSGLCTEEKTKNEEGFNDKERIRSLFKSLERFTNDDEF